PYNTAYKDRTVVLHACDLEEGRCYAYCPRTPTDLEQLRQTLYDPKDLTPELGTFKGLYITRAADESTRSSAQHGGTVTALVRLALEEGLLLALEEGLLDTAVLTEESERFLPQGVSVSDPLGVVRASKSKFVTSPNVAAFNEAAKGGFEKIGVVATPCQALALAKMRLKPEPAKDNHIDKLSLVVGLFCGWALSWRDLARLLKGKADEDSIVGMDIPPSKYECMEVYTTNGTITIPLEEVLPSVKEGCQYCFDMTAEFSDLSVGSARVPEGWDAAKGWNQVIVRSRAGQELLDLARSKGVLEFRDLPEGNLEKLKTASMNKKKFCVEALIKKSGSSENLLYLDPQDPVLSRFIN
ncbi:MAG: Coenzyme F420 hydrogenase/dehydrogenase, beta subunit C-terminal domain, partial [Deltaproteobacteria bacterium]|nr:Coenzyme F420 hydrogenase/dehydrogenase, beta subunit C-terminal domain [Deltaproteobacteria bacterium]